MKDLKELRIMILGLGYIGLPTGITFAKAGFKVKGFDTNKKIIKTLKRGEVHIVEPDLQKLYKEALNSGNFEPVDELEHSDVFIITVPTPFKTAKNKKIADLSYVKSASKMIARVLQKGNLIILESTVPPNTTKFMTDILENESGLKKDYFLTCHCPERVLPGKILYELENNDRVIGAEKEEARELAKEIYSKIVKTGKIYTTNDKTAEMCKLVENTFRDINIAFANELALISDKLGINVFELINLANKHPRVNILNPGVGVGGHCIAVDPWFIVEKFPLEANIIREARVINDYKPQWIVEKVEKKLKENRNTKIGILGLAYKSDIDDLRESPSLEIALNLQNRGFEVIACEPNIKEQEVKNIPNLPMEQILQEADYFILTLAHSEFRKNINALRNKDVLDCIGLLS